MAVPYTFGTATASIPLSNLDANFATTITLGNTAVQLGNTVTTLNNMTLANVTVSSGNVTLTNVAVTTANVTTANITTAVIGTATITTAGITTANVTTANIVTAVITTANVTTANVSTALSYSGTLTGGTGIVNLGSGQFYKDASGNVGIGVTPSAWDSSSKALQFASGSLWAFNTTQMAVTQNLYYNSSGNFIYVNTATASAYRQISGAHSWWNAPSGTAGTTATLTQAMTLDTSGRLGIGTSSPGSKLDVTSGTGYSDISYKATGGFAVRGDGRVDIGGATGLNAYLGIYKSDASSITNYLSFVRQTGLGFSISGSSTTVEFSAIGTSGTINFGNTGVLGQQLSLDTATGNVGIGTASPSAKLEVNNGNGLFGNSVANNQLTVSRTGVNASSLSIQAYTDQPTLSYTYTSGGLKIYDATATAERMRIDSSGNVGIGTTSPSGRLDVYGSDNNNLIKSSNSGANAASIRIQSNNAGNYLLAAGANNPLYIDNSSTAAQSIIFRNTSSSTERMRIDGSGNVLVTGGGGLGYGTGSGGVVTQATSRTTGVTLNEPSGAITLVSAAGSILYQSFTVTNSTVAATDTVIVNQKSGTDLNIINVTAVAAGSFNITFATTGGTTTEQPVFNFAVIKGATS